MLGWIGVIAVALVAAQALAVLVQRREPAFEKAAVAVQSLATAVAIMFAGYWYVFERKGQPQANIGLEVVGLKVSADHVALQTRFTIRNLGATLLEIGGVDARLQQMNADSLPLPAIDTLQREAFPETLGGRNLYDDGTLMWPTVRWFRGGAARHIEPGETDYRMVDFIAGCTNTAMRVYFAVQRPGTGESWCDMATVSLSGLCRKAVGTKEVLSDHSQL